MQVSLAHFNEHKSYSKATKDENQLLLANFKSPNPYRLYTFSLANFNGHKSHSKATKYENLLLLANFK